jgi:Uma2 family endonuclease
LQFIIFFIDKNEKMPQVIGSMSAVLEKSNSDKGLRYDLESYHKLGASGAIPRNTELIHGVVVNKMTISPKHRKVVNKLRDILTSVIEERFIVLQESPISIGDSEPEPDISMVAGTHDDYSDKHPETAAFVVEVAFSSFEDDLLKADIYASANISIYWILDLQNNKIEAFQKPSSGKYTLHTTHALEEKIPLPLTNRTISLAEII